MITINTNGELQTIAEATGITIDTSKKYHFQILKPCNLKLTDFDEFEKPRDDFEFDASQGQELYIRTPKGLNCQFAVISAVSA